MGHDVFTPSGGIGGAAGAGCAAAEEFAENIAEITEAAESAAAEAVTAGTGACAVVGIHTGKAELVVAGALVVVGKHLVGFAHFLELFLRILVAGIPVRMVFHSRLAVGLFYFLGAGALLDTQHLIIITFVCHMLTSVFRAGDGALPYTLPRRSE